MTTSSREKKIGKLLQLFKNHPVLVDEARVDKITFSPTNGDGENQVIFLAWKEKGKQFSFTITEDGLAYADVLATSIDIEDHEGEPANIAFLKPDGKPVRIDI